MKLDKYKLVKETPSAFELHDGEKSFSVEKDHLHHATVKKIQQHFSKGGAVKGYWKGDEVSKQPEGESSFLGWPVPRREVDPPPAAPVDEGDENTLIRNSAGDVSGQSDPIMKYLTGDPGLAPSAPVPEPVAAPPVVAPSAPAQQPQAGPAMQQQAPAPTPQAPGLEAGISQATQGIQQEGAARATGMSAIAGIQDDNAKWQKANLGDTQTLIAQRQVGADALYQQVLNSKIDPAHYWQDKGTPDRVAASIGLILGGIGAGLTHGPNYAAQALDKAIDRDIEAQKINLDKGQNLLTHYMQQTHDMVASKHLLKADYLDMTAAKLASAASTMGGTVAAADALKQAGEMRMQASGLRQEGTLREYGIRSAALNQQMQRAQMDMLQQVYKQGSSHEGMTIPPGGEMMLPKEMQETLVRLPNGKVDFARTPKDAEDVRKTQEATKILQEKLRRFGALQQEHPNGVSRVLSPADYNSAQALRESILTDLNGLAGLNRFSHEEAQVFGSRIPDITELQRSSVSLAKLEELGREIDDKIKATNRTYLRFSGGK